MGLLLIQILNNSLKTLELALVEIFDFIISFHDLMFKLGGEAQLPPIKVNNRCLKPRFFSKDKAAVQGNEEERLLV